MDHIPSADEIRNIANDALNVDDETYEKWRNFTSAAIAACIRAGYSELNQQVAILFEFPEVRDRGLYKRLWLLHHPTFVGLLEQKGYKVKVDLNTNHRSLSISIPYKSE